MDIDKVQLDLLAVAESKTKGYGIVEIDEHHTLFCSGNREYRPAAPP